MESIDRRAVHIASLANGENEPPFLATMAHGVGRVVYLGCGELYRLRALSEAYHARLWLNLVRHASPQLSRVSILELSSRATAGEIAFIEARLFDADGNPLKHTSKPVLQIAPADGGDPAFTIPLVPRRHAAGWFGAFRGMATFARPGEYTVTIMAPGTAAVPGRSLSGKVVVSEQAVSSAVRVAGQGTAVRQQKLTLGYQRLASDVMKLAQKLKRSQDVDLAKEGGMLRNAQDVLRHGAQRSQELSGALRGPISLQNLKSAVQLSKTLGDGCSKLRTQVVFPGPLPATDQPFGRSLARLPGVMASLDALLMVTHAELEHVNLQVRRLERLANAGAINESNIDDLRNSLTVCRTLQQSCSLRYGKALADLKSHPIRPECANLFAAISCKPLDEPLFQEATLAEVHKAGKADMTALGRLKAEIERSLARIESAAACQVGPMVAALVEIEAEQFVQTRLLQSQQKRLEDDLFRDLLGK